MAPPCWTASRLGRSATVSAIADAIRWAEEIFATLIRSDAAFIHTWPNAPSILVNIPLERHESETGVDVHHGFEQLATRILEMVCGGASTCHAA
jgi:hypothetical protein